MTGSVSNNNFRDPFSDQELENRRNNVVETETSNINLKMSNIGLETSNIALREEQKTIEAGLAKISNFMEHEVLKTQPPVVESKGPPMEQEFNHMRRLLNPNSNAETFSKADYAELNKHIEQLMQRYEIASSKLGSVEESSENKKLYGQNLRAIKNVDNQAKAVVVAKFEFRDFAILHNKELRNLDVDDNQHRAFLQEGRGFVQVLLDAEGGPKLKIFHEDDRKAALDLTIKDRQGKDIKFDEKDIIMANDEEKGQIKKKLTKYDEEKQKLFKLVQKRDLLFAELQRFEVNEAARKAQAQRNLQNTQASKSLPAELHVTSVKVTKVKFYYESQLVTMGKRVSGEQTIQAKNLTMVKESNLRNHQITYYTKVGEEFHKTMVVGSLKKDVNRQELHAQDQRQDINEQAIKKTEAA